MSEIPSPQPAAGEGAAAPAITNEASAMAALAGLFSDPGEAAPAEKPEPTESDASASDAGADESPPTGEEEGQSEPDAEEPAAPAIEPPASWSADDKAKFAALPPDLQAVVSRRESERDKLVNQRTQEIAEQRKAAEAEREAIATERDTYSRSLQQLLALAVPEAQLYANINWQQLSVENPAEYVRLSAARDALRGKVGALQTEMQRVQHQNAAHEAQQRGEVLAEQRRILTEKIPEFADPEKGRKFADDLTANLAHYGYAPEEVRQAVDHRAILVARDAMRWRQHEAALKTADAKRTAQPAPTVQKPGAPAQVSNAQKQRDAKMSQLRRSGSLRDAAAILSDLL